MQGLPKLLIQQVPRDRASDTQKSQCSDRPEEQMSQGQKQNKKIITNNNGVD